MLDKLRRMFKIDVEKLRTADSSHLLWMDLSMLIIVNINLLYLLFGFLFQFQFFNSFIHYLNTDFYNWYSTKVFDYVFTYDLIFVGIYVTELLFRWIRSIYRKKYSSWWFYPLVHWYDVIMCIPILKGYNFLGIVRLLGLIYRLQRVGFFDLTKTFVFKKSAFVSEVLVEEVADRVIAKMLAMTQEEIQKGSPLVDKIVTKVIKPKEDVIVNYLANRIGDAMNLSYTEYRGELKLYVEKIISEAIHENQTVDALRYIPGLGKIFQEMLDKAVADITFNTIDKLMKDIINPNNTRGIQEVTHGLIETFLDNTHPKNQELNAVVVGILNESIEEIKQNVLQKEWKINQKKEERKLLHEKIRKSTASKNI